MDIFTITNRKWCGGRCWNRVDWRCPDSKVKYDYEVKIDGKVDCENEKSRV